MKLINNYTAKQVDTKEMTLESTVATVIIVELLRNIVNILSKAWL